MTSSFGLTFDYRCPFARNGHEAAVNAFRDGEDLDIRFMAFSLDQVHVEEGEPPVWERDPDEWGTGTLALLYGIAVRDVFPDYFLDAHVALFAQRHDHGLKLGHEDVLQDAIDKVGLDVAAVKDEVWSGRPWPRSPPSTPISSTSTRSSVCPPSSPRTTRCSSGTWNAAAPTTSCVRSTCSSGTV